MNDGLQRIEAKLRRAGITLRKPVGASRVTDFEWKHGIRLPEGYRRFITAIGDGGPGPPLTGVYPLGRGGKTLLVPEFMRVRQRLPFVALPFPFTRGWVWEDGEDSNEGDVEQVGHGSLLLGDHGCGIEWRLIVTGPECGTSGNFATSG